MKKYSLNEMFAKTNWNSHTPMARLDYLNVCDVIKPERYASKDWSKLPKEIKKLVLNLYRKD